MTHPQANANHGTSVFIGHQPDNHKARDAAELLRNIFQMYGREALDVHLAVEKPSPVQEMRERIISSDVAIILCVESEDEWHWCDHSAGMFEVVSNEQEARECDAHNKHLIIIYSPITSPPSPLERYPSFRANKSEITAFLKRFFGTTEFTKQEPNLHLASNEDTLNSVATELINGFEQTTKDTIQRRRWDYLRLRLSAEFVKKVRSEDDEETAIVLLRQNSFVVDDFGNALKHFGFEFREKGMTLDELIDRRQEDSRNRSEHAENAWIKELSSDIRSAILNRPAKPYWERLRSSQNPNLMFFPILNHSRVFADNVMEFDIYLYAAPPSS